ncbi:MAG: hypothetical protein RL161_312, partial [Bacteroidota bacterium]
ITLLEYFWLGLFSTLTGLILSIGGGWVLCQFFLEVEFAVDGLALLLLSAFLVFVTVAIGWWNSRTILNAPPLTVLRREN